MTATILVIEDNQDNIRLVDYVLRAHGYEVAARLKQAGLKATKVVAVTASAMVGDRERISAAGFDGYIQKPIEPEAFMADVERFLPASRP